MSKPDKRITDFIGRHHVLTLATTGTDGKPYVASAFYAYDTERNVFVITSDTTTRHGAEMSADSRVAMSIALETRIVGRIEGIQIEACAEIATDATSDYKQLRACYLKKFPYAALATLTLWRLSPERMKLTDNRLGFGKKLVWEKA